MPSAYFLMALREFGTTPEAAAALRAGLADVDTTPGGEITLGQQLRQIQNVNACEPVGWGFRLGARFEAATHGPLGFAAVSAPTLKESFDLIASLGHVRAPYFRFERRVERGRVSLRVDERVPLSLAERMPLGELLMLGLQRLVESVLGAPMREAEFRFPWSAPAYAAAYVDAFHGAVHFEAAATELAIPAAWLDLACPMADAAAYGESRRKLEAMARRLDGDDYVVARVEQLIAGSRGGAPSLEEVASQLGVSSRTLLRRLTRLGVTYSDLVDAHRREHAEDLLRASDLSVAEVSVALGYEDAANFGRACRRWFGMAPGAYRRQLRLGEASG